MIITKGLTKDYGQNRGAFDINLKLRKGEIIGFIGPNGAGKTTVLNMLTGLVSPDQGEILINGKSVGKTGIQCQKSSIGILYSEPVFPPNQTPKTIFQRTARLRGVDDSRWQELAERLSVDLQKPFGTLSLGNRKKIGIVVALIHRPNVVVVDEPTSGLDPLMQKTFLELRQSVAEDGGSVILSSHVLKEVETICDTIIMIKEGKIIKQDTTQTLLKSLPRIFHLTPNQKVLREMRVSKVVDKEVVTDSEALIYTTKPKPILDILAKHNISDFYIERLSLEELFMHYYE